MFKKKNLLIFLLVAFILCFNIYSQETVNSTDNTSSTEKKVQFTIRMGQGGFNDSRSSIGKLGGGQITIDIKPAKYPIAISISNEYYTNSADPTNSYEIASLIAVNLLYMTQILNNDRIKLFAGGGIGGLEVPKGLEDSNSMEKGIMYNLEVGVNVQAFWKIGFYGLYKYLYADKESNNVKVIDFSEHIVLLGITFNFSF